jgi:hypothetical protein
VTLGDQSAVADALASASIAASCAACAACCAAALRFASNAFSPRSLWTFSALYICQSQTKDPSQHEPRTESDNSTAQHSTQARSGQARSGQIRPDQVSPGSAVAWHGIAVQCVWTDCSAQIHCTCTTVHGHRTRHAHAPCWLIDSLGWTGRQR